MAGRLGHRGEGLSLWSGGGTTLAALGGPTAGPVQYQSLHVAADALVFNPEDLDCAPGLKPGPYDAAAWLACVLGTDGPRGVARINADFAFAAWDDRTKELTLGRDYLGARPLYYAHVPGRGLAFASEYKALMALAEVPAEADLDMVQHLQHAKLLPVGRTLLRHVLAVPPGSLQTFDAAGKLVRSVVLPQIPLAVEPLDEETARKRVADAFVDAVRRRSRAATRTGIALSGGIDSMGLACTFRSVNPDVELHTFTAGSGPDDPEMQAAAIVAGHIKSVHHEVVVTPETVEQRLPEIVWHLEDPLARSEVVPLYEVGRVARAHVDLVLTGAASDGLFAGMPKHKLLWLAEAAPILKEPLREFYHLTQTGVWPSGLAGKLLSAAYFRGKLPPVPQVRGGAGGRPDATVFPSIHPEFVNEFLHKGFQTGVSKWISKMERVFAAAGLGHTSPFFDPGMIRVAFQVPDALKIKNRREKYILRAALRSLVPPEVLNIPKFPMRMKYDAAFADMLDRLAGHWLAPDRVRHRGFFDPAALARLCKRPAGKPYSAEWGMRIWTAVATEIWAEQFLDRRGQMHA